MVMVPEAMSPVCATIIAGCTLDSNSGTCGKGNLLTSGSALKKEGFSTLGASAGFDSDIVMLKPSPPLLIEPSANNVRLASADGKIVTEAEFGRVAASAGLPKLMSWDSASTLRTAGYTDM